MNEPIGILLAAGLGTRLQPLTLVRPKPLVPLHGIPLLEFGLRQLTAAGCRIIAVNGHHLRTKLEAWLQSRQSEHPHIELRFFPEETLLGVGGGMARMARQLPPGPLLVQNGDVLHDARLEPLLELLCRGGSDVVLALGGLPLVVEAKGGIVRSLRKLDRATNGFTGVHAWSEAARDRLCGWTHADLIPFLQAELARGGSVAGADLWSGDRDGLWEDLGRVERYLSLHASLWERPGYHRLLEDLELETNWDAGRRVTAGMRSRLPMEATNCVAWDDVQWEGSAVKSVFLDGVRGSGRVDNEIIL